MLNRVIQASLDNRLLVLAGAVAVLVMGALAALRLPIDVLPDLTRPRVVLITEAHGMAPEEVERLVTFPIETAVNGASGVIAVRSNSDIGLSVVNVEFEWGTNIYTARQIVQERIATVASQLPEDAQPQLGPISSLLGQIQMIGVWSNSGDTSPLELRTLADWQIRTRLLAIPGVSQVITMGGGRKQYQVLVDLHAMHEHEVSLHQVEQALRESNLNVTGGYVDRGARSMQVRGLGRVQSIEDIEQVVVRAGGERPVLVRNIARVVEGAQVKRGDSSVNGRPAVVITVQKQPGADTRRLTEAINQAIAALRPSLPDDVVVDPTIYQQREFIDFGVANVVEALRDGSVLVVVVLLLFLMNLRTTFITLTAIPLSVLATALVFRWMGLSINVMTLGGIAVALGELVDDAIVDVENILRRLKENALLPEPRHPLRVIYQASSEVRGAIVVSTGMVILVFAPLFALSGIEGRMFSPLGVAYVVSILASMAVSLTVTPVLSYYLLPKAKSTTHGDGPLLRGLKRLAAPVVRASMTRSGLTLAGGATLLLLAASVVEMAKMGKNFLPPFDEGAAQVNLFTEPSASLEAMRRLSAVADRKFSELLATPEDPTAPLLSFTCRTGRAEMDEHVMGVNVSEYVMTLNPKSELSREELIEALGEAAEGVPGVEHEVEQPIAHLISHMLSGVTAQIAIKLYGDDLGELRAQAESIKGAIQDIPGIAPPVVEQQQQVPQLRVELRRDQLATFGLTAARVLEFVETAMNGQVVTQVIEGQRSFDLLVRMEESYRTDPEALGRTPIDLPDGGVVPLSEVARIYEGAGPNTISREDARRRIVVRVNTAGLDLASAVQQIEARIAERVDLPEGYFIEMGGQFEAQREATQRIGWLSLVSIAAVFVLLYGALGSASLVWQVLVSLPVALVGGVWALVLTGQDFSVAGMVGFISLGGIAARNGLLLVGTYLDRGREEGLTQEVIVAGSLDRLAPVLMTSLTTGLGLLPLVIGGDQPGKEILYPVATVILGGLATSTACELLLRPGLFWFFTPRSVFGIRRV
ncbi:Cobalt-zinc-cadmium resistance protein CzcA [Pirellulimonas nuda]|uniref:Cobalt-zinc-cadmium resistance protein CzcA n=1 Tax=Pirellulimonas nuda TaxID=2528009 RepID=A0A518D616_9BACT|nr:efflux RND transporter permease subunit [Pirellulimonas nuda]QDU86916.1 Cobalt-zinc-cadmium resistance protein CzcA [Pirellulimonas nuda]